MEEGDCLCMNTFQEIELECGSVSVSLEKDFSEEKDISEEMSEETSEGTVECCICYEMINTKKNNCVTECGHQFCFKCLAKSMVHNGCACPCCRSPLVEELAEDSDTEEEDVDGDSDDDDDDDDDDDEIECDIEELTRRLKLSGFKMQDVLSMLIGRYVKGVSDLDIHASNQKFDSIIDDADGEVIEQEAMGLEDINRCIVE
jgi:hypothetical protein